MPDINNLKGGGFILVHGFRDFGPLAPLILDPMVGKTSVVIGTCGRGGY
jgi:hypothetical protein